MLCQELQNAMEEGRSLRSRLRLAEEAQKAARRTEEDYEEVLRMLETELLQARQQEVRQKVFTTYYNVFVSYL